MSRQIGQQVSPLDPNTVVAALAELGVLKPDERQLIAHKWNCTYRKGACTCPGGPELVFADWNEQKPSLAYPIPERFYERYDTED